MVDSNDSFLREIKEEIDRERLQNFWTRYGTAIVGAAALVIVTVAGVQIWNWQAKEQAESAGASYQKALDLVLDQKLGEATTAFGDVANDAPAGYSSLAQLQVAASLLEEGKADEARAKFEELAKQGGSNDVFGGFAQLQAAALQLGKVDFTEMENRLNDLIKAENPWRFNANELLGMAAIGAKKYSKARESFEKLLTDENTPPAMRQRANLRMAQIVVLEAGGGTPAETPAKAEEDKPAGDKPEAQKADEDKVDGAQETGASPSQ
ncbi:MAG: tetratricopeptide repeat protein [Filomicrobium sp.]